MRSSEWSAATGRHAPGIALVVIAVAACGRDDGRRTLARVGTDSRLLGAADGRVYWARGDTLNWVDASPGGPRAIDLPGAEWAARDNALVTPGRVFFFHHESFAWVEIGSDPQSPPRDRWLSLGAHPAGFVHDGDCLYVLQTAVECTGRGAIVGVPLVDGATCPRLDVPVNGLQPRPFAADANRFYWASETCPARVNGVEHGIYAVDRATGAVTAVTRGEDVSGELHRGARGLYWRNRRGVFQSDPSGGRRALFVGAAHCLIVAGGTIYICRDDGVFWRKEGASGDHLLAGSAGVREIAVDAHHLYWLAPTGDLVRTRLP